MIFQAGVPAPRVLKAGVFARPLAASYVTPSALIGHPFLIARLNVADVSRGSAALEGAETAGVTVLAQKRVLQGALAFDNSGV